jgi:Holliday junction resolvase-like predicted endonuclease
MAPAPSTGAVSRASKSIAPYNLLSRRRGQACEEQVSEYLQNRGYQIVLTRTKVLGVEVDLIVRSTTGVWVLVEVKSLSNADWLEYRLKSPQHRRLRRVAQALAEGARWQGVSQPREVELWLATVAETPDSVQIYPDL